MACHIVSKTSAFEERLEAHLRSFLKRSGLCGYAAMLVSGLLILCRECLHLLFQRVDAFLLHLEESVGLCQFLRDACQFSGLAKIAGGHVGATRKVLFFLKHMLQKRRIRLFASERSATRNGSVLRVP